MYTTSFVFFIDIYVLCHFYRIVVDKYKLQHLTFTALKPD